MKSKALIPFFIFVILVALLGYGLTKDPKKIPSPLIGKAAPAFNLPSLSDPQKMISSESLKGKVYLLNVWASWCAACRDEHPRIVAFAKQSTTEVLGLNYKDERPDAMRWLQAFGNPYADSMHDFKGNVGIDYGVYGVPETFIIDKKGIIRYKQIGPVTVEAMNDKIIPLINQLENES